MERLVAFEVLIPKEVYYIPRRIGNKTDVEILTAAWKERWPVLIEGATGIGKTMLVKKVCSENRIPFFRVDMNGGIETCDLVGMYVPANGSFVWRDGILVRMVRNGGCLLIDEINAAPPEVLFCLHSLLDDRKIVVTQTGEIVEAHPDFWLVACGNPSWYSGLKELNRALRDRFRIILQLPVSEEKFVEPKVRALGNALRKVGLWVSTRQLLYFTDNWKIDREMALMTLLSSD